MDKPILFDKKLPEGQVKSPYKTYQNKILGKLIFTGGFMEPFGHGFKSQARRAIGRNGMFTRYPGRYNIGFDYTKGYGTKVLAWYSGTIIKNQIEGGYGYRVYIKLDIPFIYKGKEYTCYQAYAHNIRFLRSESERIRQGDEIALEGGHNGQMPNAYGSHVDLDTYFFIGKEKIHINPELLGYQLNGMRQISNLKKGDNGLGVKWIQFKLKTEIDGIFGEITESKVKTFQRENGLIADGIVGQMTLDKLKLGKYFLETKVATVLKDKPVQSSELADNEKTLISKKNYYETNKLASVKNHYKVKIGDSFKFLYKSHIDAIKN